ncbi:SET domain protein [Rhodocollybia butyracea]|uniref:SET domain protein n=1 Tax=Rhodocollybia butyracea TaxID=206335 RepID=A0A9P5UB78_9AGAR|nr:SET domain protein [Rhodocollybia butyracea]
MAANKDIRAPSNWPNNLRYIHSSTYHSSVSAEAKNYIKKSTQCRTFPSKFTAIKKITEPSHPAYNQFGLFATKKIPTKTHVLDYIGEHCDERESSNYDLSLHRFQSGESVGIDSSVTGNEARFINDYRGVKSKPNAVFIDYRTDSGELRMGIWASGEDIRKGDEILVSYGKAWWKARAEEQEMGREVL